MQEQEENEYDGITAEKQAYLAEHCPEYWANVKRLMDDYDHSYDSARLTHMWM